MAKLTVFGADVNAPDEIQVQVKHDNGDTELVAVDIEYISGNRIVWNPRPIANAVMRYDMTRSC